MNDEPENTATVQVNDMGEPTPGASTPPVDTAGNQVGTNADNSETLDHKGDPVFAADNKHEGPDAARADDNHDPASDGEPNRPQQSGGISGQVNAQLDPQQLQEMQLGKSYDQIVKENGGPTIADPQAVAASGVDTSAAGDPLMVHAVRSAKDAVVMEMHRHVQNLRTSINELARMHDVSPRWAHDSIDEMLNDVRKFFGDRGSNT